MPRKYSNLSLEEIAREAFSVLVRGEKPSKAFPKYRLRECLGNSSVYLDFLKLCIEFDQRGDLALLKQGLLWVVKGVGASAVAREAGLPRPTVYRMLAKKGNPSLINFHRVLRALGLNLWVVDDDFMKRSHRHRRPKDDRRLTGPISSGNRRVKLSRSRHGSRWHQLPSIPEE